MLHYVHFKAIKSAEEHIGLVQRERGQCLDVSSANRQQAFPIVPPPGSCLAANSTDTTIHYSFDMAQQLCIDAYKFGKREIKISNYT